MIIFFITLALACLCIMSLCLNSLFKSLEKETEALFRQVARLDFEISVLKNIDRLKREQEVIEAGKE